MLSVRSPAASNNSPAPVLNYINTNLEVKFDGSCLRQEKVTFTHKQVVNIYIVYEIDFWWYIRGAEFTLGNFFFVDVKLNKKADPDKYSYSGYCIEFDGRGSFSLSSDDGFDKNVIIFGADISSPMPTDNKKIQILQLIMTALMLMIFQRFINV